jgi:hypothetical protein
VHARERPRSGLVVYRGKINVYVRVAAHVIDRDRHAGQRITLTLTQSIRKPLRTGDDGGASSARGGEEARWLHDPASGASGCGGLTPAGAKVHPHQGGPSLKS